MVDRAACHARLLARLGDSCGAMEFRQPWPSPAQVGVMGSGVELCPTSWLSFKCYRGVVKRMPPWSPPVLGRMVTPGEGFWPAKNSTEVMCSIFSFNHVRVVSEEQQRRGELLGNRAFYTDSNEEVVSWTMLFSRGSMLYADDNKKVVDRTVPVYMKSSSRMRLPPWSLPLKDNGIKFPQCDQHNQFIHEATCHSWDCMIDCSKKLLKSCVSMLITEFVRCKNDKGGEKDFMDNFTEDELMVDVL